jgi:site-specific recombinase XerD
VHLVPFFGDRAIDSIEPDDVIDFVLVLEDKDLAAKTIRNVVATLSALFNFARRPQRRWATINPCEGIDLPDEVAGELDRLYKLSPHQGDGDLVFAHPLTGGPLPKANVTRRMRAAMKAANLDSSRFHDLRHTFGTRMAAAGVPMRTVQEWMGHKDLATTQTYADYAPSSLEGELIAAAFTRGSNLSESELTRPHRNGSGMSIET